MSAPEASAVIETGILRADTGANIQKIPLADGGEGTAQALTAAAGGVFITASVTGPLGNTVESGFGLIEEGRVAVLDLAAASGLELLDRSQLNPMKTGTYGTGELITAALDSGAKELIIGIGGSATNDGGIGMLGALGFKFLNKDGISITHNGSFLNGEALAQIASIDCGNADKRLKNVIIKVACDVTNPLLGSNGASAVFGPQKGATPEMVKILDAGLARLAEAWIKAGLANNVEQPGDGAAGGAGAALRICLNAVMESGAMLVMKHAGFFDHLADADLIITGEGKTDSQTAGGKLCSVVAREARKAGIPVALISGCLEGNIQSLFETYDYAVSIACGQNGLDAMIRDSKRDLAFAVENLIRAITMGKNDRARRI